MSTPPEEYEPLFEKGRAWLRDNLFNGDYFVQRVDLADRATLDPYISGRTSRRLAGANIYELYWSDEHGELKYQAGEASLIDQVLAQWHADLYGLGDIFERAQVTSALKAIYRYNFKPDLGELFNPCRVFTVKGEAGTGSAPIPRPRAGPPCPCPMRRRRCTASNIVLAGALYQNALLDEAARVFGAVRDHYDGSRRNPWNEIEAAPTMPARWQAGARCRRSPASATTRTKAHRLCAGDARRSRPSLLFLVRRRLGRHRADGGRSASPCGRVSWTSPC